MFGVYGFTFQTSSEDISEVELWSDRAQIWLAYFTIIALNCGRWRLKLECPMDRSISLNRAEQEFGISNCLKILVLGKLFSCQGFLRYVGLTL